MTVDCKKWQRFIQFLDILRFVRFQDSEFNVRLLLSTSRRNIWLCHQNGVLSSEWNLNYTSTNGWQILTILLWSLVGITWRNWESHFCQYHRLHTNHCCDCGVHFVLEVQKFVPTEWKECTVCDFDGGKWTCVLLWRNAGDSFYLDLAAIVYCTFDENVS